MVDSMKSGTEVGDSESSDIHASIPAGRKKRSNSSEEHCASTPEKKREKQTQNYIPNPQKLLCSAESTRPGCISDLQQ
jgi:hypothetical protein